MKHGSVIKERILEAGVKAWVIDPTSVTAANIARILGMPAHGNVLYHFPNGSLRDAIAEYAVRNKHKQLVPILIASRHPSVAKLTPSERDHFLRALSR